MSPGCCRPWPQLLPALLLAACGGSPSAPPQADQEAKRFGPPGPDKGALYVYRTGMLGLARPIDAAVVGSANAQLGWRSYLRIERSPGPVEIECKVGDRTGTTQVEIPGGQVRYVEASITMGWWAPGCSVAEVPADIAQPAILAATRVELQ